MQIPDKRMKSIAKLFADIKQWNEYHPQAPLPCGFVDKIDEDLQYLESRLATKEFDPAKKIRI